MCSLPAAVALKRGFPDCHITWVVDPRFAGIVECCGAVDEIIRFKPKLKLSLSSLPTFPEPFEAALDLQGLLKSALGIARARASKKVGYHWQREGSWLFSGRVLPDPTSFHVVDQYVDVARAVGGQMERAEFMLVPKDDDLASVRTKLSENKVDGTFAVINAGAGWATKRWVPTAFSAIIDQLAKDGIPSVLIGGKAEADQQAAAEVINGCQSNPVSMLGQTNVRELVALISQCAVHLGGDTGSTHLAAALNRPAVGLYSITKPERSCPYGQIDRCHYHPDALAQIQPEDVLVTMRRALDGN